MNFLSKIRTSAEKKTGLSSSDIQAYSPEEFRKYLEKKSGAKFRFVSEFPFIGRGNVLREKIASTQMIDSEIERILK